MDAADGTSMENSGVDISNNQGTTTTVPNNGQGSFAATEENVELEPTVAETSAHTPTAEEGNRTEAITDAISTPQPPTLNMRFDTLLEAEKHYKRYARRKGFGIRYNYRKTSEVTGEFISAGLVCSQQGQQVKRKEDTQNPKPVMPERRRNTHPRTQCPARMAVKLRQGSWVVTEYNDNHNHPLVNKWSLTGFLRCHRDIPQEDKDFITLLHSVNLETSRQLQILTALHESLQGLGYTPKDVANFRAKLRADNKFTDMHDTRTYFEELKKKDPDFFYKILVDEEDRVVNMYWVDGDARKAYKKYHDCVSFDTTYMTNTYKMPCAPFIGINNHGQSIKFGCGFMRNELSGNFIWLFEAFVEAMDGQAPLNIITDQDFGMRNGIDKVFPHACHRNCRWHIVGKAEEEIGPFLARNEGLRQAFNNCLNCSLSGEDFDMRWFEMINRFGVQNHSKLAALFEKRKFWVPAFFMHNFFPFLQTTQRSEGFNVVLKKYVNLANSVLEFVKQYFAIQASLMRNENEQEAESSQTIPNTYCYHPIEQQVKFLYTRNIHVRFQYEMQSTYSYNIRQIADKTYSVECITKFVPGYYNRTYEVHADPDNQEYRCACCKFQRDGIVCCHILKAMLHLGVTVMPDAYILKRWTWEAEEDLVEEIPGQPTVMPEKSRKMMKLALMCNEFKALAIEGNQSDDGTRVVGMHLKNLRKDLLDLKREAVKRAKKAAATAKDYATSSNPPTAPNGPPPMPNSTTNVSPRCANSGPQIGMKRPMARTAATIYGREIAVEPVGPSLQADSDSSHVGELRDPRKSNTKGRKKKQAFHNPLNINRKEKRTCKQCGSENHDYRTCQQRGELPDAHTT